MNSTCAGKPPVTVTPGQIQLVEACLPPLAQGEYEVTLDQILRDSERSPFPWSSAPYHSSLNLCVTPPRFHLDPALVRSVFPPSGEAGAFDAALPHVVLARRTLPWERILDAPTAAPEPWVALLLVAEGESAGAVRPLPVVSTQGEDSLLFPASTDVLPPDLRREDPAELRRLHAKEACLAVDLPCTLFQGIAPRRRDLPYLAHARQVDTGDKEIAGVNDKGWFAVVVGNRRPQADRAHRALLVSLEGHQHRLEDPWPDPREAKSSVRLAVLATWGFRCTASNDFKARMTALKTEPAWLSLRGVEKPATTETLEAETERYVDETLRRGYTALDHGLRHGERTVSWYRGPLVPVEHEKAGGATGPARCADELLRYDPQHGLFDVSYAGAWQLGRLLALQNPGFVLGLDRARRSLRARAEQHMRAAELDGALAPARAGDARLTDRLAHHLANGGGARLRQAVRCVQGAAERDRLTAGGGPSAPRRAPATPTSAGSTSAGLDLKTAVRPESEPFPADVTSWLGRLVLLYGVPLCYLVPDQDMLPPESLRLFRLDPFWIHALVRGACSVGDASWGDSLIRDALNGWLLPSRPGEPSPTDAAAARVRDTLRARHEGVAPPEDPEDLAWPLTGLLLRSSVVRGWRGLEVAAHGEGPLASSASPICDRHGLQSLRRLRPLRIEQLSEDVLIGIFNGPVAHLVVRQPQESLHFGLPRGLAKTLRALSSRKARTGQQLPTLSVDPAPGIEAPPAAHARWDAGVVDVAGLADRMRKALAIDGELPAEAAHSPPRRLTSAELAVQMIETAGEFHFCAAEAR